MLPEGLLVTVHLFLCTSNTTKTDTCNSNVKTLNR